MEQENKIKDKKDNKHTRISDVNFFKSKGKKKKTIYYILFNISIIILFIIFIIYTGYYIIIKIIIKNNIIKKTYKLNSIDFLKLMTNNNKVEYEGAKNCLEKKNNTELCLYQFFTPKEVKGKNRILIGDESDGS